jgi:hypothetical protein
MKGLLFLIALFLASNVYAGSTKENYELQERCGQMAKAYFNAAHDRKVETMEDGYIRMYGFSNHYNRKLNKCFILETMMTLPNGIEIRSLQDVNENKIYGTLARISKKDTPHISEIVHRSDGVPACIVSGLFCHSEAEWEMLIRQYMEE